MRLKWGPFSNVLYQGTIPCWLDAAHNDDVTRATGAGPQCGGTTKEGNIA